MARGARGARASAAVLHCAVLRVTAVRIRDTFVTMLPQGAAMQRRSAFVVMRVCHGYLR